MSKEELIKELVRQGKTMKDIGRKLGVSRQRIYQLLVKYGIHTTERKKHGYWKNQPEKLKWLWRTLSSKPIPKDIKWEIFEHLKDDIPETCPILNKPLTWGNCEDREWSLSIDRIDSTKGYEVGNIHLISWRANRIKNDGTSEEHRSIADYLDKMSKSGSKT